MNRLFLLLIFTSILACNQQHHHHAEAPPLNLDSIKDELKQTDLAFSNRSKEKGQQAAFLEYMDENVSMLRPNSMPVVSRDSMRRIYSQRSDTSFTLTWSPLFADVAASGELGYTYGTWLLVTKAGEKSEGTYCTIWKKDANGNWKFVLDMGNEGLKPPEKIKQ